MADTKAWNECMERTVFSRQPIYEAGVDIFAYELFSRNGDLMDPAFAKPDALTAVALLQEFVSVGLDDVVGPYPGFVTVNRDFVVSEYSSLLPPKDLVLQISRDTVPDTAFLKCLSELSSSGYSIALNDLPSCEEGPLAELADIVKLDVSRLHPGSLKQRVDQLKALNLKVLAEKVETYEEYERCKAAGFDYFEGHFFCKPNGFVQEPLPSNRLSTLHLLATLQDPNVSLDTLEQAVGRDLTMSYRILRYLNAPAQPLRQNVKSLRHAIALVGTALIRNWASMIWLHRIQDKPRELMVMSIIRAQMCRQLAIASGRPNTDQFFTVGLLSLLEALLDRPLPALLHDLPLTDDIKSALLKRDGLLGEALNCVQAYERCDWDQATFGGLDEDKVTEAYVSAVAWSRAAIRELVN